MRAGAAEFAACLAELMAGLPPQPDLPHETPQATLSALWLLAAGQPCSAVRASQRALPELSAQGWAQLRALLQARLQGTPLAHLTARQHFMGLEMMAGREALIPRPETELLAHSALALMQEMEAELPPAARPVAQAATAPAGPPARERRRRLRVLDVCTGSGNLALAVAHHAPQARVWGSDLCERALGLARRNAQHLGLSHRVQWRAGDLLQPFLHRGFAGRADLLLCNPPYLPSQRAHHASAPSRRREPRLAFDGGGLGINVLLRLLREAPRVLRAGGWLVVEVGEGQGPGLLQRLEAQAGGARPPYAQVRTACDAQGAIRVLMAQAADSARFEPAPEPLALMPASGNLDRPTPHEPPSVSPASHP
jgi:release factor glutamine methyltransferase